MEQEHFTAFLKDRGFNLNPSFISVLYKSFDGMLGGTTKSTIPVDPNAHLEDAVFGHFPRGLAQVPATQWLN